MLTYAGAFDSPELDALGACSSRLVHVLKADAVFVLDMTGQLLAQAGNVASFDARRIAAVAAAMMVEVSGLAGLVDERHFREITFDGASRSLHFRFVLNQAILVTCCDSQTPLGLVRLWCGRIGEELEAILQNSPAEALLGDEPGLRRKTLSDPNTDLLIDL